MKQPSDLIFISNLVVLAQIGCTREERSLAQNVSFDIEIVADLEPAAISGDLEETICYAQVATLVSELVSSKEWVLVETLARETTASIFSAFDVAQQVKVSIKKFVVDSTDAVGVSLTRTRA